MPSINGVNARQGNKPHDKQALFKRIDNAAFYCVSARLVRRMGFAGLGISLIILFFGNPLVGGSCCIASASFTALGYALRWIGTRQIIDILKSHYTLKMRSMAV